MKKMANMIIIIIIIKITITKYNCNYNEKYMIIIIIFQIGVLWRQRPPKLLNFEFDLKFENFICGTARS